MPQARCNKLQWEMLFSICSHEEFAWGQSLLKQLLSFTNQLHFHLLYQPWYSCTNWFYISALLYLLLWFTAVVPTAPLSVVQNIICCYLYQLWSNAVPYQPPVYQASSADTDAAPSMRADTQRIEIKIWAVSLQQSILRFSRVVGPPLQP